MIWMQYDDRYDSRDRYDRYDDRRSRRRSPRYDDDRRPSRYDDYDDRRPPRVSSSVLLIPIRDQTDLFCHSTLTTMTHPLVDLVRSLHPETVAAAQLTKTMPMAFLLQVPSSVSPTVAAHPVKLLHHPLAI